MFMFLFYICKYIIFVKSFQLFYSTVSAFLSSYCSKKRRGSKTSTKNFLFKWAENRGALGKGGTGRAIFPKEKSFKQRGVNGPTNHKIAKWEENKNINLEVTINYFR